MTAQEVLRIESIIAEIENRKAYWQSKPGLIKSVYCVEEDRDIIAILKSMLEED